MPNLDEAPRVVIVWRSQLHWIGGLMTLFTIVLVLAPLGLGGLSAQALPRSRGRVSLLGSSRLVDLMGTLALAYFVLSLVTFMAFQLAGVESFAAFNLAMTAVSSGGFLPSDAALLDLVGPAGLVLFASRFDDRIDLDLLARHDPARARSAGSGAIANRTL